MYKGEKKSEAHKVEEKRKVEAEEVMIKTCEGKMNKQTNN